MKRFTLDDDRNMFDGKPFFCVICEKNPDQQLSCKRKLCALEPEILAAERMRLFLAGVRQ